MGSDGANSVWGIESPVTFCLKFVSGRWDYFNDGGSLIIPAPQFVSGGWDNGSMKRKLASAIVVMGLLASSMAPASAIFGLSKCEKVKRQILSYEKQEKPLAQKWVPANGQLHARFTLAQNKTFFNLYKSIVKLEVKMYTLEKNNPKCFTITQNEYINKVYPYWKERDNYYKFNPTYVFNPRLIPIWSEISWDSIYNQ